MGSSAYSQNPCSNTSRPKFILLRAFQAEITTLTATRITDKSTLELQVKRAIKNKFLIYGSNCRHSKDLDITVEQKCLLEF